jgi:hypothetical protein
MTFKLVDGVKVPLTPEEIEELKPPSLLVPRSVSMRQARLALLAAGLLSTVQTYMDNMATEAVRIEWEYATDVHRDRDLVTGIGQLLGLTDVQIDALFVAARAIP